MRTTHNPATEPMTAPTPATEQRNTMNSQEILETAEYVLGKARQNNTHAKAVDGSDPEEIAQFVMEGVLDNDHVNNGGEPEIWDDEDGAISVYTDNDLVDEWDDYAIDAARPIVRAAMKINGNIE